MKRYFSLLLVITLLLFMLPVDSFAGAADNLPRIVQTVYPCKNVIVADAVLTEAPYFADNTGRNDCSDVLQRAIDDLYSNGGGTVFLPVGTYRLCKGINVRPFVCLAGDRQDPDCGNEYGTVIIADTAPSGNFNPALFTVGGSSGVSGLTVWYEKQSVERVIPYPYTFYIDGVGSSYMLQTISDVTLLNSYRGIGACTEWKNGKYECHEMLTVENVKGTCLKEGLCSFNSADVDTVKGLHFSGKYWSEAGEKYNAPDIDKLNAYTEQNLTAFTLGDLEWPEMCDMSAEHCKYGIYLAKGPRAAFSGTFFNLRLTACRTGIFAEDGSVMEREKQWGYSVCNSEISAYGDAVNDYTRGVVMLTNVEITGKVKGKNIHRERASTDRYRLDCDREYVKCSGPLYVVQADKSGRSDIYESLQTVLDKAGKTGGTVYLPAGIYRLEKSVSVPPGVELRGSGYTATRDQSGCSRGTLILAYGAYADTEDVPEPLISLRGDNCGIYNIRVSFVKNKPADNSGKFTVTAPAFYASGKNIHVINCFGILASDILKAENCENLYVKHLTGCGYQSFITADTCSNLMIEGCLQNGNTIPRNGYSSFGIKETDNWLNEGNLFENVFIPITRVHTDFLVIKNSDGTLFNTFIYGGRRFLRAENSRLFVCGVGCDGQSKDYCTYTLSGGETTVIGTLKSTFDGKDGKKQYECDKKAVLKLYDRISVDLKYNERTILKNVPLKDIKQADFAAFIFQPVIRLSEKLGAAKKA